MRVFITGGTGFVGSVVVPELLRAGHQVRGLARSEASANALKALGADIEAGDLDDLGALRRGALAADAIIHAGFDHDLTNWEKSGATDQRAIEAFGDAIRGSERRLLVTSGAFAIDASATSGELATESDPSLRNLSRATETVAATANATILRLGIVHGPGDRHFVPGLIAIARAKGLSAYVGDGAQRWPAVHLLDTARAYRLALENGARGETFHAIAEEGVPVREIAAVISRKLGLPLVSQSPEEAAAHFGPLALFVGAHRPTSSAHTRAALSWTPRERTLLEDLETGTYFA